MSLTSNQRSSFHSMASGSSLSTRRSLRLKNRQSASKPALAAPVNSTSAARTRRTSVSAAITPLLDTRGEDPFSSSPAKLQCASGSDPLRSRQISRQGLNLREELLFQNEAELKNRMDELERRIASFEQTESEASAALTVRSAIREKECILEQLQDHFLCCLCYEVLAAPYVLNASRCGHTFCGLCILKWFFSRLHRHCGTWHESVDCPMCRSLLIITPEHIPRLQLTFPFVPNRIAASVIESLLAKLVEQPRFSQAKNVAEMATRHKTKSRRKYGSYPRREIKLEDRADEETSGKFDLADWLEDGRMRIDWLERVRKGKEEMTYLMDAWSMMKAQDFISMKEKLGV